ncbi:MAG TPA: PaaI family thioesterase [Bacillota bacterium]|jgi:acyl-CoA thioesterase|nr:PaaI family thioesterase [Bacillota bacterium]HQC81815.1 PaaI family thioesterase [Bacillota bacterium]
MSRLKELLIQEKLEKGVEAVVQEFKKASRINEMMNPTLAACSEEEQTITIEFSVSEWQLNEYGTLHAGIIATAFDEAMGIFAAYLGNDKSTVSVNLSLNYIKPIPSDDSILITAKVTSAGRRIITISAECRLKSNGLLTNTAIGTYAIV